MRKYLIDRMIEESDKLGIKSTEIDSRNREVINNMPVPENGSLSVEDEYALRCAESSRIEREYGLDEKRYVRMFSGSNRRYIKRSF